MIYERLGRKDTFYLASYLFTGAEPSKVLIMMRNNKVAKKHLPLLLMESVFFMKQS